MKLKFEKNKSEEIIVSADGNSFTSQNYIDMIKQLHEGNKLDIEFGEGVSDSEKESINKMVETINTLDTKTDSDVQESNDEGDEDL